MGIRLRVRNSFNIDNIIERQSQTDRSRVMVIIMIVMMIIIHHEFCSLVDHDVVREREIERGRAPIALTHQRVGGGVSSQLTLLLCNSA